MKQLVPAGLYPLPYLLLMLLLMPPLAQAQAALTEGWQVNRNSLVNLYHRSPLELADDSSLDLLAADALTPAFHSLTLMSPDLYGLRGAAEITNSKPDYGSISKLIDRRYAMQMNARAIYSSYFDKGNVNFWLGALWRQQEVDSIMTGLKADASSFGYNVGVDLQYADIRISGSYFDGQAINDLYANSYLLLDATGCLQSLCMGSGNQGYVLKGSYAVTGTTRFGVSYGESSHYALVRNAADSGGELWTVGLYHDINPWFKISAEYSNFKSLNYRFDEPSDMISIGGYIRW